MQQGTTSPLRFRRPYNELPLFPRFFSLQLEVFLRYLIGKDYLSVSLIFWTFLWLAALTFTFYKGINIFGWQLLWPSLPAAFLFGVLAAAFLIASIMHKREMSAFTRAVRNGLGEEPLLDSWDDGRVRDFWHRLPAPFIDTSIIDESTIKRFFEPLPFLAGGAFLLLFISKFFGGYLLFCALAMLYTNHKTYNMLDRAMTDHKNALIRQVALHERATGLEQTLHKALQNEIHGSEHQLEYFRNKGRKPQPELPDNPGPEPKTDTPVARPRQRRQSRRQVDEADIAPASKEAGEAQTRRRRNNRS